MKKSIDDLIKMYDQFDFEKDFIGPFPLITERGRRRLGPQFLAELDKPTYKTEGLYLIWDKLIKEYVYGGRGKVMARISQIRQTMRNPNKKKVHDGGVNMYKAGIKLAEERGDTYDADEDMKNYEWIYKPAGVHTGDASEKIFLEMLSKEYEGFYYEKYDMRYNKKSHIGL